MRIEPGDGVIEFQCPTLPVVAGLYRVDLAIESGGLEIDVRQRCATLRVEPGRIAYGDFHIENTWKVIEASPHAISSTDEIGRAAKPILKSTQ